MLIAFQQPLHQLCQSSCQLQFFLRLLSLANDEIMTSLTGPRHASFPPLSECLLTNLLLPTILLIVSNMPSAW